MKRLNIKNLSPLKKKILIFCALLLIVTSPFLIRLYQILSNFPPKLDVDSAIILVEWSDNEIAKHFDNPVDVEESRTLLMPLKKEYGTKNFRTEGPFSPYTEAELDDALEKYQPQIKHIRNLVENDKVLVTRKADYFRNLEADPDVLLTSEFDDLFDRVASGAISQTDALIRSHIFQDLERGNHEAALKNLKFHTRIANPVRAQNEGGYNVAVAMRRQGYRDYQRILSYAPSPDILRRAWQDMIDLRDDRIIWSYYPYIDMRDSLINMIDMECAIKNAKNDTESKIPDSELMAARVAISMEMLSKLRHSLYDCYENADLFQNPATRRKARKNGNPENWKKGFLAIPQSALMYDWYTRTARKDSSIFKHYNLPQDILEKVDHTTAMIYLQSRWEHYSRYRLRAAETKCQLYEMSIAANIYHREKGQWPENIEVLRGFYQQNGQTFPDDLYGEKDAFHCGSKTLEGETLNTFLEVIFPLDDFRVRENTIKKDNTSQYIDIQINTSPGKRDLLLYEVLRKHDKYLKNVTIQILETPTIQILENGRSDWQTISSETVLEINNESIRLGEAFDKESGTTLDEKKHLWEMMEMLESKGQPICISSEDSYLNYQEKRDRYISNPENRSTPYPNKSRIRCEIATPEKTFAIWRTTPEAGKGEELYINLIVFPDGY